ncbi:MULTISPECIES: carbohydrate kinase family protein [Flavobacteriaceae]|uniref:carbohydrate kinase family protein n=1 Tax=Flavobacteriaceae TaxID=49546 RepID=UPI001491BA67|nr:MULTISPECIES: carbohydrate kinase [Allomuricauda]MDC6365292.1 carbohydrate kinase [Muricauda sp. AC10]
MKKVFCVGELLIDFVAEKQGNDLSKATEFTKKAGGAPANVACAIAKLGGKGVFVGCVGEDPFGKFLLDTLKREGVDISLAQFSKTFTTLAFVSLAEDGERDFVFSRGADQELVYDPSLRKSFHGNLLHLGAATALLGGNLEKTYGKYLFDGLTKEMFISFDPNFRGDLWKENEQQFIKKCMPFVEKSHLCKFSLEEAQLLSGKTDLNDACDFLHEVGTKIITITLGKEGTLVSMNGSKKTVPSIPVQPVDTTGAGDAFIGCLLQQIADMGNLHKIFDDFDLLTKMVAKANKAGAITTTNFGAINSLPTKGELEA